MGLKKNKKIQQPVEPIQPFTVPKRALTDTEARTFLDDKSERVIQTARDIQTLGQYLYNLIAEKIRPITITIDPETDPETAVAINRLFGEVPPQITGDMYLQVLEYVDQMQQLEIGQSNENPSWEVLTGTKVEC